MSGQQPPPYPGPPEPRPQPPPYPGPPPHAQPPQGPPPQGPPPQGPPPQGPPPQGPPPHGPPYPGQQPPGQQAPAYPGQQPPAYGPQQPAHPGQYGPPGYAPQQPPYAPQQPPYAPYQPPPAAPPDSTARLIGWLIAATGLLVGVAAFLTWGTVEAGGRSFDINGVTGSDVPEEDEATDGIITLVLAVIVIGFSVVRAFGPLSLASAIIGTVMGALVTLIAIVDMADLRNQEDELGGAVEVSIGIGLWLTLLGGIAMLIASIVGIVKRR